LIFRILFEIIFDFQNLLCIFAEIRRFMRIISHKKLRDFFETPGHEDARVALERWYDIASNSNWRNLGEIRTVFPATDYVGNQHYVFNIRGNRYRLVVVIKFVMGYIFIRFVGTHAEYDKIDCSTI
jgi:mRNA interferase HigB